MALRVSYYSYNIYIYRRFLFAEADEQGYASVCPCSLRSATEFTYVCNNYVEKANEV